MGTAVVIIALSGCIALSIRSMIQDKKKGKSLHCGCDCSKCGGGCHQTTQV